MVNVVAIFLRRLTGRLVCRVIVAVTASPSATAPLCLIIRLLDLWVEEFGEELLALVDEHVGTGPALASSVLGWFSIVNLRLLVSDHTDARIVELHPLTLALDDRVVVPELQTLTLVDHNAFEVVDLRAALAVFHAQLFRERDPKI